MIKKVPRFKNCSKTKIPGDILAVRCCPWHSEAGKDLRYLCSTRVINGLKIRSTLENSCVKTAKMAQEHALSIRRYSGGILPVVCQRGPKSISQTSEQEFHQSSSRDSAPVASRWSRGLPNWYRLALTQTPTAPMPHYRNRWKLSAPINHLSFVSLLCLGCNENRTVPTLPLCTDHSLFLALSARLPVFCVHCALQ